jgi:hypothetical protein
VKHKDRRSEVYPTAEDFKDNTTMVQFSLMFHYTPEFKEAYRGDATLIRRRLQSGIIFRNVVYSGARSCKELHHFDGAGAISQL